MQSASILILEHINTLARVYSLALQGLGYSVKTISDGAAALDYLEQHKPAVILLDLRLLGISSTELLTYIKSQKHLQQTKIILMSTTDELPTSIEKWVDCILDRPAPLSEMSTAVRHLNHLPDPSFHSISFA